jgi:hypothetical protein
MNYAVVGAKKYPPKEELDIRTSLSADDMVCIFL